MLLIKYLDYNLIVAETFGMWICGASDNAQLRTLPVLLTIGYPYFLPQSVLGMWFGGLFIASA